MPYIDSTPKAYPMKFEEDNLQDVFAQMLVDNGWTLVRTFFKAVADSRAYHRGTDRANYAVAKHAIFRNADGQLLGFATAANFYLLFERESIDPIRRPHDTTDLADDNFGISPTWDSWVRQRFADANAKTNLYFYMLEKMPSLALVPNDGVVTIVTMPGMSGTAYILDRDKDRMDWKQWYYTESTDNSTEPGDADFDGKIMSSSPFHVIRSALDIEVLGTSYYDLVQEVKIHTTDPRVMQSPIVKTTLRAEFLEHIDNPVWHTNWWTDSEVRVKGHVDSNTIFLTLQADNAPAWGGNLVPTIPLYFGKIRSMDGDADEGYALFSGTVPPARRVYSTQESTLIKSPIVPTETVFEVENASKLPNAPSLLTINGVEIVLLVGKEGNTLTVLREQQGTEAMTPYWIQGTSISRLSNTDSSNETVIAMFDFDDPKSTVGEIINPLLKLYPNHASNGVDSVMLSRSNFGARYQAHYLSWNAPPNQLPPFKMSADGRKYPSSYNPVENTDNYKYQFNASRYSGKVHSSRIYVVHPEEGVRGYLDKSIGFNPQSVSASNLRVRKADCPEKIYEMYKYQSIGAVSPMTKLPTTPFRAMGLGIYSEDFNPNAVPHDLLNDATPAGEVTITKISSPQTQTISVEFELPSDVDLKHVNIYVDRILYATGVTRANLYRIVGLQTGFSPEIKLTTVDLAGNESIDRKSVV